MDISNGILLTANQSDQHEYRRLKTRDDPGDDEPIFQADDPHSLSDSDSDSTARRASQHPLILSLTY